MLEKLNLTKLNKNIKQNKYNDKYKNLNKQSNKQNELYISDLANRVRYCNKVGSQGHAVHDRESLGWRASHGTG